MSKVAVRKHEPIHALSKHPLYRVLPTLFSHLSLMEVLLEKKRIILSQLDMTNEISRNMNKKQELELIQRITLCDSTIQNLIKTELPNSNISYFLFQYDLSMLFPNGKNIMHFKIHL